MNENLHAIVLIFNGKEPQKEFITELGQWICANCNVSSCAVGIYDKKDIADMSLAKCLHDNAFVKNSEGAAVVPMVDRTPEDEAVIYIGTILANALASKSEAFVEALVQKIGEARENPEHEQSRKLMNALFILSQKDLRVSKTLLKKYNLSEARIRLIKHVYTVLSKYE